MDTQNKKKQPVNGKEDCRPSINNPLLSNRVSPTLTPVFICESIFKHHLFTHQLPKKANTQSASTNTQALLRNKQERLQNTQALLQNKQSLPTNTQGLLRVTQRGLRNMRELPTNTQERLRNTQEPLLITQELPTITQEALRVTQSALQNKQSSKVTPFLPPFPVFASMY